MRIILSAFALFLCINALSQVDIPKDSYRHQISVGNPSIALLFANIFDDPAYAGFISSTFKTAAYNNSFFRLDVMVQVVDNQKYKSRYIIALGKEYKLTKSNRILLNLGWEFSYAHQQEKDRNLRSQHFGLAYILSFSYFLNERWSICSDLQNSFGWISNNNFDTDVITRSFKVTTNRFISLELAYHFGKN